MAEAAAALPSRLPQEAAIACVGILAGGGRLPLQIAESVTGRGGTVHIVGIEGEADADIARFPHTWVNWGQIGRMVATLHGEGARELVIAGAVRRPNLWRIRPDAGFFRNLPLIMRLLAGGDDFVLTRVVRFFEGNGFTVRGVHEVAPDLLAGSGPLGAVALSEPDRDDAMLGFAVREALGAVDTGQAVAIAGGRILAIEGAEGTDAMLERVARLPGRSELAGPRGVLAKGPKPRQEMRIDMPTIGPRTVAGAAAAGLAGVAIENGAVLVLDREETIREGDRRRCAVVGLAAGARGRSASRAIRQQTAQRARRRPRAADAAGHGRHRDRARRRGGPGVVCHRRGRRGRARATCWRSRRWKARTPCCSGPRRCADSGACAGDRSAP